jgi:hypothetical protein
LSHPVPFGSVQGFNCSFKRSEAGTKGYAQHNSPPTKLAAADSRLGGTVKRLILATISHSKGSRLETILKMPR